MVRLAASSTSAPAAASSPFAPDQQRGQVVVEEAVQFAPLQNYAAQAHRGQRGGDHVGLPLEGIARVARARTRGQALANPVDERTQARGAGAQDEENPALM